MTKQDKPINWTFIIDSIKKDKSVLILGPELVKLHDNKTMHQLICDYLNVFNNERIKRYYPNDELFFFEDNVSKLMVCSDIRKFYQQKFEIKLFEKIAFMPFPLIISLNPDLFLKDTFERYKFPVQFAYYSRSEVMDLKPISTDNPLIYNLFGTIENDETLILTHDDLFDFISWITAADKLPQKMQEVINKSQNFIFVGFKFDKWYLQLILRMLNPQRLKYQFALESDLLFETQTFYLDQFRLDFFNVGVEEFIDDLYNHCSEANMLRKKYSDNEKLSSFLNRLMIEGKVELVFEKITEFFETSGKDKDESLVNDIVLLRSRLGRLNRKIGKGIIDSREADLEENKIYNSTLELIKEIAIYE